MIEIEINYEGQLYNVATHGPSGATLQTDAPVDNNGKGESFSPTDLVATALGSCMATVMGIIAERKSISLEGLKIKVRKHMSSDTPRRIARLEVDLRIPLPEHHEHATILKAAARGCPVHQSLHPEIELVFHWEWNPQS